MERGGEIVLFERIEQGGGNKKCHLEENADSEDGENKVTEIHIHLYTISMTFPATIPTKMRIPAATVYLIYRIYGGREKRVSISSTITRSPISQSTKKISRSKR